MSFIEKLGQSDVAAGWSRIVTATLVVILGITGWLVKDKVEAMDGATSSSYSLAQSAIQQIGILKDQADVISVNSQDHIKADLAFRSSIDDRIGRLENKIDDLTKSNAILSTRIEGLLALLHRQADLQN